MKSRSYELELMDLGPDHYSEKEYRDCLQKLGLIGSLFGSDRQTLSAFAKLKSTPKSILEVGCGNGALALKLARNYPGSQVLGIDLNPQAIEAAFAHKSAYEKKHKLALPNLSFEHRKTPELMEPPKSYDVVTATLLCHHLSDAELPSFLKSASTIARNAVIINDLHRHPLAYAAFWLISPLFNNRMIRRDGLLSINRSFKYSDLVYYLQEAGLGPEATIHWSWNFRWTITIRCL